MPTKSAPIAIRLNPEHMQQLSELAESYEAGISQVAQTCIVYALNQLNQNANDNIYDEG